MSSTRTRPLVHQNERKHFLVVEDGPRVSKVLSDFLRFWFPEYQIESVETGEQAVVEARSQRHQVILMDIGLPGMNGIEAARQIKTIDPGAVIVIVTIHGSPEYREEAISAGADAFVLKDRMYAELVPVMRKLLEGRAGVPQDEARRT